LKGLAPEQRYVVSENLCQERGNAPTVKDGVMKTKGELDRPFASAMNGDAEDRGLAQIEPAAVLCFQPQE